MKPDRTRNAQVRAVDRLAAEVVALSSMIQAARTPIPHRPESVESLAARFPLALVARWDLDSPALAAPLAGPGQNRDHVFDFHDGFRIVASMDYSAKFGGPARPFLHVSASVNEFSDFFEMIRDGRMGQLEFLNQLAERYRAISLDCDPFSNLTWSQMGIPHLFRYHARDRPGRGGGAASGGDRPAPGHPPIGGR